MNKALTVQNSVEASESLVAQTMRAITDHIRDAELKLGQPIPSESAFALKMGVSRAVVREAFSSLAMVGVIEVGNGRRARVGGIDETVLPIILNHAVLTEQVSVQQIYDVRRAIEQRTVVLAALRRTPAEAEMIVNFAAAMDRDFNDPNLVQQSDISFHETIARASKNPMFALILSSFRIVTEKTWYIGWASRPTDEDRRNNVLCHKRIAAAILQQDAKEAEALMVEHFNNSVRALLAAGIT
jgi:GntR family transcriptional regulator, transcriptional repressor for pyruvate dehydrogenase complex